ncbi:hypothetical protein LNL84_00340 [Vibrio sp. ZSDZ34]|jgi:hypothetical protein|uniref:Uncharacterized protein n=1 Tax=Vibrio gelatinilyticus TaxID=2893468 RepID=A0A9X1W9V9_9VIBR|nr:hypothetical protein [Vibrio gelatinilyticus]MCJ2375278.1 hypothetical protein [Vibrio gelatinilyticus]
MRTLTRTLTIVAALLLSVGVLAHMGGGYAQMGFQHPMMNEDNPQYQAMLELRGNPEAMQAWMESMHENPQAMQEWMNQMHANYKGRDGVARFGCHGRWQPLDNPEESE